MTSCFLDVAALLGLGSLCSFCIPGSSVVSSWPSVLYDRGPYAVLFLNGGSSVSGRRPTSTGIHHRPGPMSSVVGGALRRDAGLQTGPSVLILARRSVRVFWVRRGWILPLQTGLRLSYTDAHQGLHPFLTGFRCGRPLLMVRFCLGLVGIHPGNERTHSAFHFLLPGFHVLLMSLYRLLKGTHFCKHFLYASFYFSQQACHNLFRLHSLAV
jgi:hypothetical protein